ncbi:hypothetical protein MRB53_004202 [Persea americana]|uniref:Uncharacterized protein n=1 Tax=Persea americana TaxID=3435 RepID=A0ACC2N1I4_PERAE|nr:hypothetical protein MRB53_004202 [Persea americana]
MASEEGFGEEEPVARTSLVGGRRVRDRGKGEGTGKETNVKEEEVDGEKSVGGEARKEEEEEPGDARARKAGGGVEREEGHHYSVPEMTVPGFLYTRPRGRCTPQFWSSRREAWPRMVPEMASVSKVFGSLALERYRWDLTLLEATERNDDGTNAFSHLLKQSTAALLNSYSRTGFPYTPWEVKTLFIQSLVSVQAAAHQANLFSQANNNIASCV